MTDVGVWKIRIDASATLPDIVRMALARALGTEPAAIELDRRCRHCGHPTHGKPEVVGAPELSFSLSHSRGLAVLALAFGAPVGADVEMIRPRRYLERIAARILTADEFDEWRALAEADQLVAFLRHWTAREAYLKAIGVGIGGGMKDALAGAEGWTIAPIKGLGDAVGALAVEGKGRVWTKWWPPVP